MSDGGEAGAGEASVGMGMGTGVGVQGEDEGGVVRVTARVDCWTLAWL